MDMSRVLSGVLGFPSLLLAIPDPRQVRVLKKLERKRALKKKCKIKIDCNSV